MTTKIICDKCGKVIEADSEDHFKIGIKEPKKDGDEYVNVPDQKKRFDKRIDLCSKCFKDFNEIFLKESSEYTEMYKKFLANQRKLEDLKKKTIRRKTTSKKIRRS